jgi:hypothetical protein
MSAVRRRSARFLVPRAPIRAQPLYHLDVPTARRGGARYLVPRFVVLAQQHQLFELPAPRRCVAQVFSFSLMQYTSP